MLQDIFSSSIKFATFIMFIIIGMIMVTTFRRWQETKMKKCPSCNSVSQPKSEVCQSCGKDLRDK